MPSGGIFAFGPHQLDTRSRRLLSHGAPVVLSPQQFDLLHALVASAGQVVPKDRLIEVAWQGVAVGDSSLEKQIFHLRQRLDADDPHGYIRTVPRRGYQLVAPVTTVEAARADVDVYALLAPHRAWLEGRAALETLELHHLEAARTTMELLVRHQPRDALFHAGLATAYVFQYEATRADLSPNTDALRVAAEHAHEACRLGPDLPFAWITLGFILERTGARVDAWAALHRAVKLEPDAWQSQFRLSAGTWGEERYRAARRTLALYQGFPMAHWLAASVLVARGQIDQAEREIDAALEAMKEQRSGQPRFSAVAIHLFKGLLCLARGAEDEAMQAFASELALEPRGHLYGKECCANAWYAIGACHLLRGESAKALEAFREAITRVPRHPMAHAGLVILGHPLDNAAPSSNGQPLSIDVAMARAAVLVAHGDSPAAAALVAAALDAAPPGNGGWLIPLDPLLGVQRSPDVWAGVLRTLRDRAA